MSLDAGSPTPGADVAGSDWPRLVCISTDVDASAALQATVASILPDARAEAADTSIVRGIPDAECVILAVGAMYSAGVSLIRELRARGYERSIILVVESPIAVARDAIAPLGVGAVLAQSALALQLPGALERVLQREAPGARSPQALAILTSLRHFQTMLAVGEVANGLQHKLNNPLAALLAEAQLLELEPLGEEHAGSVRRIVELCRRVIDVSRSIEGLAGSTGG